MKDGKASDVAEKTVQFVGIPKLTNGTCVYLGQITLDSSKRGAVQSGGPYQAGVRVTTVNGLTQKAGGQRRLEDARIKRVYPTAADSRSYIIRHSPR